MATAYEENKKARQAFIPEEEADVRTAAWSRRRNNVAKAQSKCYCLTSLSLPKSDSDEGDLQGCSINYPGATSTWMESNVKGMDNGQS